MSAIYTYDGTILDVGNSKEYREAQAKTALTGKVWIALGDSYTVGMGSQLSTIASKYGMILDNRGKVSATISYRSTDSARRLYNIADTVVSNYTNGYAISGTTYHASDVGIITFMGGANDGSAIESWIGTGIHETANTTIYGSLNHIFSVLQETFTNAKIICVTQPSFYSLAVSDVTTDESAQGLGFDDLAELQVMSDVQYSNYCMAQKENAVRNIAWAYGIPVLDMFNEFPSVNNPTNRTTYWQNDKLHLTTAGYDIVADGIDKKIVEVVVG